MKEKGSREIGGMEGRGNIKGMKQTNSQIERDDEST